MLLAPCFSNLKKESSDKGALYIVPDNRDDKTLEKHLQLCDARKLVLNGKPE